MCCRNFLRMSLCCALIICWATMATAAVKLPALFADNMVLQQDMPVPVWGWADKGEEVTVSIGKQTLTTKADDEGRWKVVLDKLFNVRDVTSKDSEGRTVTMRWRVRTPSEMTVKGSSGNTITIKNILIGEVWVCSGQSNMEMGIGMCDKAKEEIAAADYPQIRLFMVPNTKATEPANDVKGTWKPCTPENIAADGWGGFSATAYYFGRMLRKELGVPIGLIDTTWGGTPAEFWTSRKALEVNPALKSLAQGESSCLYNGMIAPLIPYAIRGAIWYQGESNASRAYQYRTLFPAMIANWRADWGQGDFPFSFVQLAPFRYEGQNPASFAELCEAQRMTLNASPNTGMAVTMDIGNVKDIHPTNKQDVGRRLALWALAKTYGQNDLVYSGPLYKSMTVEGDTIRLTFDHANGGPIASDGKPLTDFTVAGEDQTFVPATAEIDGETIVVHGDQVAQPAAVRYAWRDDATPNLANKEGLPASSFRTDTWKGMTEP